MTVGVKQLFLIRGIPGSGKSTLAKLILRQLDVYDVAYHFEADMYFYSPEGTYDFDATKLGAAHNWCQNQTEYALRNDCSVIVSNTFTTCKELKPYFTLAKDHGIIPTVIHAQNMFQNIHSVPDDKLKTMRDRFQYDLSPLFNYLKE